MIIASLIGSIEDSNIHCELQNDQRYERIRNDVRQVVHSKEFLNGGFEVISLKEEFSIHFLQHKGVVFVLVYDKNFPKKLGKACLKQIQTDFENYLQQQLGQDKDIYSYVSTLSKPYSLLRFDKNIKKILRGYENTRSEENLKKINDELNEIKGIMDKSFEQLVGRGRSIQEIREEAELLKQGTQKYRESARKTRLQMQLRQYLLYLVLLSLFLLFLLYKFVF